MWKKFDRSVTEDWFDGQLILCEINGTPKLLVYDEGKFYDDMLRKFFCTLDEVDYYMELPKTYGR